MMKKVIVVFFSCMLLTGVKAQSDSATFFSDSILELKKNWVGIGFSPFYVNLSDHREASPKMMLNYKRRGEQYTLRLGAEMEEYRDHDGLYKEYYKDGVPAHLIGDTIELNERYLGFVQQRINLRIGVEKNWTLFHNNWYLGADLVLGTFRESRYDYVNTEYYLVNSDTTLTDITPFDRVVDHTIDRYWTVGLAPVVGCEFYVNSWFGGAIQYSPRVAYQVGNYSINSYGLSDIDYDADFSWKRLTDHHLDVNWGYIEAFIFLSF